MSSSEAVPSDWFSTHSIASSAFARAAPPVAPIEAARPSCGSPFGLRLTVARSRSRTSRIASAASSDVRERLGA